MEIHSDSLNMTFVKSAINHRYKKVKQIFQTKKGFITCSKLMINELGRCPTSSENVYFANDEQASMAVFTSVFCFTQAEHNLIKLKLYNN